MKKLSLILALMAGVMLPLTATAKPDSSSKKSKRSKGKDTKAVASDDSQAASNTKTINGREVGSFTNEQILLNNKATDAVNAGDFKKAENFLAALNDLGEFNVVWYQLGRTYARQDKCLEAYDAFNHVADSRILAQYEPEVIAENTRKAIAQLDAQCSAKLVFTCVNQANEPTEMMLSIDGNREFECSSKPIPVVPGKHSVYAKASFGFNTVVVDGVAGVVTNSKVIVSDFEKIAKEGGVTPEELEKKSTLFKALGYSFIGVGTALAVGGGVLMYYSWNSYNDYLNGYGLDGSGGEGVSAAPVFRDGGDGEGEDDQYDSVEASDRQSKEQKKIYASYGLIGAGGAMLVTGLVLVIIDAAKIQPQLEEVKRANSAYSFAPIVSPDFAGLSFRWSF